MINNHFPTVFSVVVALAALAVPANAAEVHEVPAVASPGNAGEAGAILAPSCWFATRATARTAYPKVQALPSSGVSRKIIS